MAFATCKERHRVGVERTWAWIFTILLMDPYISNSKQDEPTTHIDTIQTLSLYKNSMLSLKMLTTYAETRYESLLDKE